VYIASEQIDSAIPVQAEKVESRELEQAEESGIDVCSLQRRIVAESIHHRAGTSQ
jgi:hypothetical protein